MDLFGTEEDNNSLLKFIRKETLTMEEAQQALEIFRKHKHEFIINHFWSLIDIKSNWFLLFLLFGTTFYISSVALLILTNFILSASLFGLSMICVASPFVQSYLKSVNGMNEIEKTLEKNLQDLEREQSFEHDNEKAKQEKQEKSSSQLQSFIKDNQDSVDKFIQDVSGCMEQILTLRYLGYASDLEQLYHLVLDYLSGKRKAEIDGVTLLYREPSYYARLVDIEEKVRRMQSFIEENAKNEEAVKEILLYLHENDIFPSTPALEESNPHQTKKDKKVIEKTL